MTRLLPLILLAALVAGCAVSPTEAKRLTSEVRTRASSIQTSAAQLAPHVDKDGKPFLDRINADAKAQIVALDAADKIIDSSAKYQDNLEARWNKQSGSIGVKLERIGWFALYAYLASWLISYFVVPALGPGNKIGQSLTRFFPMMNPASWLRDLRKPEALTVTTTTPSSSVTGDVMIKK